MINFKKLLAINILFVFAMGISAPAWSNEMRKKLLALNACPKCDLEFVYLDGLNLSGAKKRNAKLDGAILCKTKTPWGIDNSGC